MNTGIPYVHCLAVNPGRVILTTRRTSSSAEERAMNCVDAQPS
jgi:hypothetical protein